MTWLLLFAVAAEGCAGSALAQGTTQTVLPYGLENQNGNAHLTEFRAPTDAQHWFRASYLGQVWTTPVSISEVAFRVNEQTEVPNQFNAIIPRVEIWLTTTSRDAQTLNGEFNFNAGPDARAVFASDNVVLSSPGGAGPNPFGLRFAFSQPFYYDPQAGNLILRVRTFGTGGFTGSANIDAQGSVGPLSEAPFAMRDNDAFPTTVARSVVTQFGWAVVPEPSVGALIWPGVVWLLARRRGRRRTV